MGRGNNKNFVSSSNILWGTLDWFVNRGDTQAGRYGDDLRNEELVYVQVFGTFFFVSFLLLLLQKLLLYPFLC